MLAQGQDGEIFRAHGCSGHHFAVKRENFSAPSSLYTEATVYAAIHISGHAHGFARTYFHGQSDSRQLLVLDLLGPDLHRVVSRSGPISLENIFAIGAQVIDRLHALHNIGFVHGDLNPSNLVLGRPESDESRTVFLIDFGRSSLLPVRGSNEVRNRHQDELEPLASLRFGSSDTMMGETCSLRDDMESLMYTLIYLYKGELPWGQLSDEEDMEMKRTVAELKKDMPVRELCAGMGMEFNRAFRYVRLLGRTQRPNYEYLRSLMESAIASPG